MGAWQKRDNDGSTNQMFWTQLVSANIAIKLFVHAYRTLRPWLLEGGQPPAGWKEQVERDGCLSESEMEIRRVLQKATLQCSAGWWMKGAFGGIDGLLRFGSAPNTLRRSLLPVVSCILMHINRNDKIESASCSRNSLPTFALLYFLCKFTSVITSGRQISVSADTFFCWPMCSRRDFYFDGRIFILLRMTAPEHTALTFSLLFAVIYLMTR